MNEERVYAGDAESNKQACGLSAGVINDFCYFQV